MSPRTGGTRTRRVRVPWRAHGLPVYLAVVGTLGISTVVVVGVLSPPWEGVSGHPWQLGLLALALVIGEQRPIPVSRNHEAGDEITISTSFAIALVALGPLSFVLYVHTAAVLLLDVRMRREPRKIIFNIAQYAITLAVGRAAFCLLTGVPYLGGYRAFEPDLLLATLAAGLLFFIVNHSLVAGVIAQVTGQPFRAVMREDLDFVFATTLVLVSLGPLAAYVVEASLLMLPLLFMPILAVHRSTSLAMERERQALHDSLTGLPNREHLRRRAERALAERAPEEHVAFVLLDLDHFKEINDTLGHQAGDDLIVETGRRLTESAPKGALVVRLGGDEFAVLLHGIAEESEVVRAATTMLEALSRPSALGSVRLAVSASAGIALAPAHGGDTHTLLKHADIALYEAKEDRGRVSVYRRESDLHSLTRLSLLADLRGAVEAGELVLHYQPVVDAPSGVPVGVEALVRWEHPELGRLAPDTFIALAENTGLIAPITHFVIDTALEHNARLRAGGVDLGVAINLSMRHITDLALPEQLAAALQRWGVPAYRVTVEVTETGIMSDPTRANAVLAQLRRLGLVVAVDDYGTGQASLSYLKRLEVDELKIDRSFVTHMLADRADDTIVRSTIELAHDLGLRVVAEGVEDDTTWRRLQSLGCDFVQGYLFGRPVPYEELETLLAVWDFAGRANAPMPAVAQPTRVTG